jgi:hypothetical protein
MKLEWEQAKVGCHWMAADFFISTRITYENGKAILTYPRSGYVLTHNRAEVGMYKTLKAAQRAAQKIAKDIPYGVCAECREEIYSMNNIAVARDGALVHNRCWSNV